MREKTNRLIAQNREPRNIPTSIQSINLWQRSEGKYSGTKRVCSTSGARTKVYSHAKKLIWTQVLHPSQEINLKKS